LAILPAIPLSLSKSVLPESLLKNLLLIVFFLTRIYQRPDIYH
jgi:hypothetical protein